MEIINKTLELLDDVIEMNSNKYILRILNRLKKNFELNSIEDNEFYNCLIESYDELDILSPKGMEELREIFHLSRGASGRIHHGVSELERELTFLESAE